MRVEEIFGSSGVRDSIAVFAGARFQQVDVATAALAELEILADDDVACAEPCHQHFGDEHIGGQRGKGGVEVERVEDVGSVTFQEARLGAERRQAKALAARLEEFLRMRLEDEDAELSAQGLRVCNQRLVAAMHAVKIADGNGGPARGGRQILVVPEDLHPIRPGVPISGAREP
jgi:hypothetical protein